MQRALGLGGCHRRPRAREHAQHGVRDRVDQVLRPCRIGWHAAAAGENGRCDDAIAWLQIRVQPACHAEADQPPAVFPPCSSKRPPKMAPIPTQKKLYPGTPTKTT